jgi:AcrR family transcriptional regulator
MSESPGSSDDDASDGVRARILEATAQLIGDAGPEAATTRAIASAAGVQAPAIYRLFGDKRGLLDAVAEHSMALYVASKSRHPPHPDPVQDLRDGWDMHVAFGLANPGLFALMSGDPHAVATSPAISSGHAVLLRRVHRIALAGRLRVSEARAVSLIASACVGTVLTLLRQKEAERDAGLSVAAREAIMNAIASGVVAPVEPRVNGLAAALRASLPSAEGLSRGERQLLEELLDRLADGDERR